MHTAPDYAVCYVILTTESGRKGYGMTFTLGTGTDIIVKTIDVMRKLIEKQELDEIINNFADFWRKLTSDSQLRWVSQMIRGNLKYNSFHARSLDQKKVSFISPLQQL